MEHVDFIDDLFSNSIENSQTLEIPLYNNNGELINYLSQWPEYQLPEGHCIVNKTVCGCGYTQYCLTNSDSVILVSPRKTLIKNKAEQNPNCFYFTPIELTRAEKKDILLKFPNPEDQEREIRELCYKKQYDLLYNYLFYNIYVVHKKILVTNDSFPKLSSMLASMYSSNPKGLNIFKVVVDEFQLIFNDARFKADTELNLLSYLQDFSNVTYVSATPIMKRYLEQIPGLSELPYLRLDWGPRVIKPKIERIKTSNISQYALEEIKMYKEGNFCHVKKNYFGVDIISRELVIYVSNISIITSLIKKSELTPDQVNIIVAETEENRKKIKQLGKGFDLGKAPLRGQPHKMFTFCTSTAYCGVDFYSTNARTLILSNCSLSSMSIDISLELPQILGRQRLIQENPFALDAVFVYTTTIKEYTLDKFKQYLSDKIDRTTDSLNIFQKATDRERNTLREERRTLILTQNYSTNYSGIDQRTGDIIFNRLVYLSEIRAWEIQNKNYENDISVITSIIQDNNVEFYDLSADLESKAKRDSYEILAIPKFEKKLKICCEYYKIDKDHLIFKYLPSEFKYYLDTLGVDNISKVSYAKSRLDAALKNVTPNISSEMSSDSSVVINELKSILKEGESYSLRYLKNLFREIKEKYGLPFTPKAVLLKNYCNVLETHVQDSETNKRSQGYTILSFLN